ncbi:MAG: hypothetical protein IKE29_11900 [Paenibacillus sp.]|uniref:SAM-dependent methyltransferase n=1 Tax=Paenibacillus sp. TaxID=58172 RepID=UPI0025D80712|nr:SAM-dependent methyltransferase [Paenibacillus sp.]MBR2565313.1 hypothetical protein [Paenibacillus sp.]
MPLQNGGHDHDPGSDKYFGAGPGDAELITVEALRRTQSADVILYDRLVTDDLLAEAQEGALRIYCGRAPSLHSMSQEMIGRMLASHAARC